MKRVFSNAQDVIHLWAQQTQDSARCGNVYFEDAVVYSYGNHYPLGLIAHNSKGNTCAVINTSGYSLTTSKHIGWARYASNHYQQFSISDTELMKALCWNNEDTGQKISAAILRRINRFDMQLAGDHVKRKPATLEKWRNEVLADCDTFLGLMAFYGSKPTREAKAALKSITGGTASDIAAKAKKAAEVARRKRERAAEIRRKEREAIAMLCLPAWREGKETITIAGENYTTRSYVYDIPEVKLRLIDDEIQTSKGARFPKAHGLKALPLIRAAVKRGEGWQRNGHTIHLGHYQIDKIAPNGDVTAGCHFVPFAEIERLAHAMGV